MTDTGRHYEIAFEAYLKSTDLAYVPLSQIRKAILHGQKLKSFDYIIHNDRGNALLVDIKGRKLDINSFNKGRPGQNWVTIEDVTSMLSWQENFGLGHDSVFVFAYWLYNYHKPTMEKNNEIFHHNGRYYWLVGIYVVDYNTVMKPRSTQWNTVSLPQKKFRLLSKPFINMTI